MSADPKLGALRGRQGMNGRNGHVKPPAVRLVPNIKVQNSDADQVVMLLLGEEVPELGAALTAEDARTLATALLHHADLLTDAAPRIISPGDLHG